MTIFWPARSRKSSLGAFPAGALTLLGVSLLIAPSSSGQGNLPPNVERQMAAGVDALKSGDLDAAEKIFSDAVQQGVKHPLLFHNLGVIAQERKDHQQAVARFREAIALQPEYGPSRLLLGVSLLALGRTSQALRELKLASRRMPAEPQAHWQLARAYQASEDWIAAVQELQTLVRLAPHEPEYSYQLGRSWMKLSGWSYQQIRLANPQSARLQQGLGQEYAIQEKYDMALEAYRRAARLDPKMPEIHLAIAAILLETKKLDEALREIALEQKLVPESKAAAEVRARIEAAMAGSP